MPEKLLDFEHYAKLALRTSKGENQVFSTLLEFAQPPLKGIYTRLLSGQTCNHSIFVGLNCLQLKTGDQRCPVVVSS